jgi:primosomal protein N' (replication factor Y)
MKSEAVYCQIVLKDATRQFDREYTYEVPESLTELLKPGSLVEVPFGRSNRAEEAYVLSVQNGSRSDFFIKQVSRVISARPVLTIEQLELGAIMKDRYTCTYGAAFRCMTPSTVMGTGDKTARFAGLTDEVEASQLLAAGEIDRLGHIRVIEMLLEYGSAPVHEIQSACQVSAAVIRTLEKKGLLEISRREVRRSLQSDEIEENIVDDFAANSEQAMAIDKIRQAMTTAKSLMQPQECLLYGITGSGKTEVYLQSARKALESGYGVIILVPEISLTPQMTGRIRSRFGNDVAVLHSRLTPSERYEQWQRILREEVRLVVGARSAVFAPIAQIGLIVIDEEQEGSYKSETHPRYHARDIALIRARMHGAALVCGSATPSVESFYRTRIGKSTLLELPERIGSAGLPKIEIADMRDELRVGNRSIFSRALQQALLSAHAEGRQSMIFINRRGYAGFVLCRSCGHVIKCQSCSVSLTSHQSLQSGPSYHSGEHKDQLVCHYCGKISRAPDRCPLCGSGQIGRFGVGTQQVEELFARQFPEMRTLRMDQDTTSGRSSHAVILDKFAAHEADVLIGTQMIAKGHDFPNVTLVGILAADQLLGMSDFRASERAFQLIMQSAGRAGRGSQAGRVILQAYNTDDYAIQSAADHNYTAFYNQEIAFRKMLSYPPFGSIGLIVLSGQDDKKVRQRIEKLYDVMTSWQENHQNLPHFNITEPGRAPMQKIRGRYRWRIVIQAESPAAVSGFLTAVTERFNFEGLSVTLDVDPWQML